MLYDLANPSDAVTFKAETFDAALCATILVGNGNYSATPVGDRGQGLEDEPGVLMFFMGIGFDDYFKNRGEDFWEVVKRNRAGTIKALRSFCTGSAKERRLYDLALTKIDDPVKRADFREKWNSRMRASLNDIVGRAHALADWLEDKVKVEDVPESGLIVLSEG